MSLPPPLAAGPRSPEQVRGVSVETLAIKPVVSLPVSAEDGQIVRLASDGRLWSYNAGVWTSDAATAATFTFDQSASAISVWTINHGLGHRPVVKVVDLSGTEVIGEVVYTSLNVATVTFLVPVAGYAYLT